MQTGKTIKYVLLLVAGVLLVAAAVLWAYAHAVPPEYQPAGLTPQERAKAAKIFVRRIMEMGNSAQVDAPFAWSLSQEEFNGYLDSLDEIAQLLPSGREGMVRAELERSGLSGLAVKLEEGRLRLMVRSRAYGHSVLSLVLRFESHPDPASPSGKAVRVYMDAARIGKLSLPDFLVREELAKVRFELEAMIRRQAQAAPAGHSRSAVQPLSTEDVTRAVTAVLEAIDEKPIQTEVVWPINKRRVRIDDVQITPEQMTLHMTPAESR